MNWFETSHPALLQESVEGGAVRCGLSPRHCVIKPGQRGFCGVRANQDGKLVTLNYGKSVHATVETIETEAVFHFAPGERILSMGNVGCMLNCDYCQNWKTSQVKYLSNEDVYHYTPEEVVDIAVRHGIRVISWTYNDPVVWQEFVLEAAALAKKKGIINLYKSAFFISPEAIEQLLPVIDIFSISLKSMDPTYYRKLTKGWIEPVLEGAKQVYKAGKHLEVSTLMVTGISDNESTARAVATFVRDELGPEVPLHFVRFHPDYKLTDTVRTPIENLERAREVALEMGIRHVYLGNVYDHDAANSYCSSCQELIVTRYGLNASLVGLDAAGNCIKCGTHANIKLFDGPGAMRPSVLELPASVPLKNATFEWHGDVRALHVQLKNTADAPQAIYLRRFGDPAVSSAWDVITLAPGESHRFISAKGTPEEKGIELSIPEFLTSSLHEVFDRAHFPTVDLTAGSLNADISPMPAFKVVSELV